MLSRPNPVPRGRRVASTPPARPRTRSRALLAGPLLGLVVLVSAPPADALTISAANVNPPEAVDSTTRNIIYYLDLQAGPQDERFSVALAPPAFATKGGHDEGRSVDGPRQITLLGGPGTVGELVTEPSIGAICSDRDAAYHGYATGSSTLDVHLPAGAKTTLAVRYATGRRAPWVDTDFTLRFSIQQKLFGTYPGSSPLFGAATSVEMAQTIKATPALKVQPNGGASKIGAHIVLSPRPKGPWGEGPAPRAVKQGATIKVTGQVLGAPRGKRVDLQWRKNTGPLRVAKTVITASGGRFSTNLTVPGKGNYELWARYPNQPGGLKADTTSCPVRYRGR